MKTFIFIAVVSFVLMGCLPTDPIKNKEAEIQMPAVNSTEFKTISRDGYERKFTEFITPNGLDCVYYNGSADKLTCTKTN